MTPKEMHLCKNVKNFFYSKYKYNTTEQIIYTSKISFKILAEMWDFLIGNSVHRELKYSIHTMSELALTTEKGSKSFDHSEFFFMHWTK